MITHKPGDWVYMPKQDWLDILNKVREITESTEKMVSGDVDDVINDIELLNHKFCNSFDIEKKQFVKRVEKRVFDGDEEWYISGNRFYTYVSDHKVSQGKVLSNMFECALWDTLYVDISSTGVSTVTEFKTLISANPLIVVYELATPIITNIFTNN